MKGEKIDKMVSMAEVIERLGLSRSTIFLMVKSGTFPAPIKLGVRRIAWRVTTIDKWIKDREAIS